MGFKIKNGKLKFARNGYSNYLDGAKLNDLVKKCAERLEKEKLDFDAIVVSGVSGTIVGAPLAMALGKRLLVVRKPGEYGHDPCPVAGASLAESKVNRKILVLDDECSTGDTIVNIFKQLNWAYLDWELAGIFLYLMPKGYKFKKNGVTIDVITL